MRRAALVAIAVLALSACVGVRLDSPAPVDQLAAGAWATLAPMPTPRQEVAVAALDGRIWVIGGFGVRAEPTAAVEIYDPRANQWSPARALPAPVHHAAAAVVDGRLFVVGGYTGGRVRWTPEGAVHEYDRQRDAWMARAPMPTPRGGLAVTVLGGRVHAVGGAADRATDAHEVYDPAADRWRAATAMPTARDHLSAVSFQDRLWAIGGRESFFGTQYASVEIYDPATGDWRTGTPLPVGRGGLAAVALADRVFVVGGEAPLRIFSANEMYEAAGDRWIAKTPLPTPRHGMGAAVVDGRIYVPGGGREPGFAVTGVNEAFTP